MIIHYSSSCYYSDELDPADEQVNFLEVDDVAPYLKFEPDDKGGFTLSGGPLDALIAYAASTSSSGKVFTHVAPLLRLIMNHNLSLTNRDPFIIPSILHAQRIIS